VHKVTLQDGTVLDKLELNGNNYISDTLIDDAVFTDNLGAVEIDDGGKKQVYKDMKLVANQLYEGKSWFILAEKTLQDKMEDEVLMLRDKVAELESSLIKTDAVAEDLKSVLISKDVIQEADLKAVEEPIKG
jgi:hypothetical protein